MIDDDLNSGQSSPPPPAPNGENSAKEIFQPTNNQQRPFQNVSWNPFCTPALQQSDSHLQISSMNPFAADLMKQQVSPFVI